MAGLIENLIVDYLLWCESADTKINNKQQIIIYIIITLNSREDTHFQHTKLKIFENNKTKHRCCNIFSYFSSNNWQITVIYHIL